ncbi:MAG: hypothetical protein K8I00_10095, partial [Candidatus Omnitrophica bacterium]|nr:hypothetical protein [Candidatus Omnitrophota bacterium]
IEEYNSSNVLQADYVMGARIDEPLTMTRNSTTYYYHVDGLGNVRQFTNGSGTIVESYDYDPYGQVTIYNSSLTDITISGSGIDNPYMFTGRRLDEESGIYHYRARQYDPAIGRILQRDPLGYYDSMNLYEYVSGNPTNSIDPMGLFATPLPTPNVPGLPSPPSGLPLPFPPYPGPEQPIMCEGSMPSGPLPEPPQVDIESPLAPTPTSPPCNDFLIDCEPTTPDLEEFDPNKPPTPTTFPGYNINVNIQYIFQYMWLLGRKRRNNPYDHFGMEENYSWSLNRLRGYLNYR